MFYRLKQLTLIAGDYLALLFGFVIAISIRYRMTPVTGEHLFLSMVLLFLVAILIMFICGLYDLHKNENRWPFFQKIIITAITWFIFGVGFFYLRRTVVVAPKTLLILTGLFSFGMTAAWRYIYNRFLSTGILHAKVVFVGFTPEVNELVEIIASQPNRGYSVIGFVSSGILPSQYANFPRAATLKNLIAQNGLHPDIIVVAPTAIQLPDLQKELYAELTHQTGIVEIAKFYAMITGRIPPFTFSESWFLANLNEGEKKVYDRMRIVVDYTFASLMAVIFAVTFPFIAAIIKWTSKGPLFFIQERVGRAGKNFKIYKYRTMYALSSDGSAEVQGAQYATVADTRITKFGKFLRRSRLDELPQFINIFKNEMGVIGPRPERAEFVAQLLSRMPFYNLRHLVKPGLTGWAQIKESYYGTLDENLRKLEYDLYYIMNRNFWLDLAIILRTFSVVIRMGGR